MDDLKKIVAKNITELRTSLGLTQLELAERLNYSDKSVSKWERGESIPDAYVLKALSGIFGVTVDSLLSAPGEEETAASAENAQSASAQPAKPVAAECTEDTADAKPFPKAITKKISLIALIGVFTLVLFVFIIFWMSGKLLWIVFLYAFPAAFVALLVLSSIWEKGRYNYLLIGAFIFSLIVCVYFSLYRYNFWQLFLLLLPAELIVYLCSRMRK